MFGGTTTDTRFTRAIVVEGGTITNFWVGDGGGVSVAGVTLLLLLLRPVTVLASLSVHPWP